MSANGQYQTAVSYENGIYVSNDYGKKWVQSNSNSNNNWTSVAMSANGQYQIAITTTTSIDAGMYISINYGILNSWIKTTAPIGTQNGYGKTAMSANGQYLNIFIPQVGIYTSITPYANMAISNTLYVGGDVSLNKNLSVTGSIYINGTQISTGGTSSTNSNFLTDVS
ncbi:MAG: hypothetical protein EBS41_07820, partial [Actinobacteria bacterium]|nr:hypothetical protein [Actinomycetota bacterium]